eukprot:GHVU01069789.1.p1 GENE.GHVU01069789.1~~GHVU01069789.1.p1  ORF type:complete len:180 (+),score=4.19 GHVU01069789.1:3-542(+)
MAFANWGLSHVLRRDATPNHLYILADNGYPQVPYTMTPFNRLETPHGVGRAAYNNYLSEVRATIERTFGLLVGKWRILKRPLCSKFSNHPSIIEACIRLHNYCIDERMAAGGYSVATEVERTRMWNGGEELSYPPYPGVMHNTETDPAYNCLLREAMVQEIVNRGLVTAGSIGVPPRQL